MSRQVIATFKLILVGDSFTGKTTFVNRHLKAKIETKDGFEIYSLPFDTNMGLIIFHVWITTGQEKIGNFPKDYYHGAQCGLIMFSITSRLSYKNVACWHRDLLKNCETMPIVICGNQIDVKERSVLPRQILYHVKNNLPFYFTSGKSNYNFEKPFLWLAQQLIGDLNLKLYPDLAPPEVEIDHYLMEEYNKKLRKATELPLPMSDDDL